MDICSARGAAAAAGLTARPVEVTAVAAAIEDEVEQGTGHRVDGWAWGGVNITPVRQ